MNLRYILIPLTVLALAPAAAQTSTPATSTSPAPATAPAQNDAPDPLATAVLDFESSDDLIQKQGANVAVLLQADLSASQNVILVERQEIEKILSEQELGASGLVSSDTAAKIGSLTGAKVLITGRLFAVGSQYVLVGKIISTETSRVYGVTATVDSLNNLPQATQSLADKIDAAIGTHRDTLVVAQETPDQRLARLRTLLPPAPLPTVSVKITEQDYTAETIDPAAQTEFTLLLQQLGFKVIDPDQSHQIADIAITGEAFSELGSFHGDLVSGRGRIEIKLTRTANQDVIMADRETQIAVAVGARVAGKDALEKAADKLIFRIVPKLTK
jgi:hypothetical protein